MGRQIPEVVVSRLPMYVRALTVLKTEGIKVISSKEFGARFGITPDQVRKDLSYCGRFGRQGRGYDVGLLLGKLSQILGLDQQWLMIVVGVGRLGRALMDYRDFVPRGFRIVAAFDRDPSLVGKRFSGVVVQDVDELESVVEELGVSIAIVAVPVNECQEVVDRLVQVGVKSILNYAPIWARVPPGVQLRSIDPVLSLQGMTFYLWGSNGTVR